MTQPQDSAATTLMIQIMPLLMREFQVKLDPQLLFSDPNYAEHMLRLASTARNERLKHYAGLLHERLRILGAGPIGALRSSEAPPPAISPPPPPTVAPEAAPGDSPAPAPKYIRSLR
jgi:hypothetical protein